MLLLHDEVSLLIHISFYLPHFPSAHYLCRGQSPCLRPVPQPCNDSAVSTSLHPAFTTNSIMFSMGRNMSNAHHTFNPMMSSGLLTIWTRYAVTLPSPTLHSVSRRFSTLSILPVLLPGNVYMNSETCVAPEQYFQHHTCCRLTFWKSIPNHSPLEASVMCTREHSVVQRSAPNACEYIIRITPKRSVEYIF